MLLTHDCWLMCTVSGNHQWICFLDAVLVLVDLRWAEASWRQNMWHQADIRVLQWIWLTRTHVNSTRHTWLQPTVLASLHPPPPLVGRLTPWDVFQVMWSACHARQDVSVPCKGSSVLCWEICLCFNNQSKGQATKRDEQHDVLFRIPSSLLWSQSYSCWRRWMKDWACFSPTFICRMAFAPTLVETQLAMKLFNDNHCSLCFISFIHFRCQGIVVFKWCRNPPILQALPVVSYYDSTYKRYEWSSCLAMVAVQENYCSWVHLYPSWSQT